MPTSAHSALIDTKAAAAHLGLAPITLAKLRISGAGPRYVRLTPRAIRYRPADLTRWVEESQHRATAEYAVTA